MIQTRRPYDSAALASALHPSKPTLQRGKPLYHRRPWSRVLDEMDDAEVRTVGALEDTRIAELHDEINRAT